MRTSYPSRRSIRLPAYDYRTQGAYFVTIGTHERRLIFERELWRYIAHQNWQAIEEHFPDVTVDEYIVMPNHVHGILLIERPEPEVVGAQHAAPAPPGVAPGSLGAIIRAYKASVTQAIRTASGAPMRVWQRNYYEHVVRDEASLQRIRQYIVDNPARWEFDRDNPRGQTDQAEDQFWREFS